MFNLLLFTLVGVGAQLVDGALGMAFGVTATTLLMIGGLGPAQASAAVHLAEVGTTLASGVSHWKFKNIDWKLVAKLGVPGAVGAFIGATVLSGLSTEAAVPPITATILLAIGIYVALRFSVRPPAVADARTTPHTARFLSPTRPVRWFYRCIRRWWLGGSDHHQHAALTRKDRAAHRDRLGQRLGVSGRVSRVAGIPCRIGT